MTLSDLRALLSNANVAAFLRVIRARESSQDDSAYTVLNGGAHFEGWEDHPFKGLRTPPAKAAGAYQFIASTWAEVAALYGLTDFSPKNQDMGAVGRVIYRGALDDVLAGRIVEAIVKCRKEWTSLPGAAESSSGWTMDKALAIYRMYGGTMATQPAAPSEDRSTEYAPPVGGITEGTMGAIALPLLAQLLPQVLGLFSQRAQATIAEKTGADPKLAAQFMQTLIAQVGTATGITVTNDTTATQAVAALTALPADQKATKVAAVELQALATLDDLLRAGDKSTEWDAKRWAAEMQGRKAASEVAIEERKAGLWDMTKTVVWFAAVTLTILVGALLSALIYQAVTGTHTIDSGLLGLAGPIFMAAVSAWGAIIAYRFDGTKESSEQTKALNKALDNGARQ